MRSPVALTSNICSLWLIGLLLCAEPPPDHHAHTAEVAGGVGAGHMHGQ